MSTPRTPIRTSESGGGREQRDARQAFPIRARARVKPLEKSMSRAIVVNEYGGPEVLRIQDVTVGDPGPGQVRIRHVAIGVNFHDVYVRSGLYKTLSLPGTPGIEASAEVTAVGDGVERFAVGDRVAYVTGQYGVYAAERLIDAETLIALPASLSHQAAASVLLRGLTVEMLLYRVHAVKARDFVLVQAAAGGVGQLLCQWASRLGAIVIGATTEDQMERALAAGCQHVIRYQREDLPQRVAEITGGRGVAVVYDGVGQATFAQSLESLAYRGHLVNFGQASGSVPPFEVSALAKRSNSLSRPIIFHYLLDAAERAQMADNVFKAHADGWLRVNEPIEFDLADAAESHRVLESQGASRPLLLRP